MNLAAALIYWVIVAIWLTVLTAVVIFYLRNPRAFGTTRLLLAVIAIDTLRNVAENVYFGLFFGARYQLFPTVLVDVLGNPTLLILPKLANVAAGCLVFGLLLGRWLPAAMRERRMSEQTMEGLRKLAAVDGMTGLFNRTHFTALADAEWDRFQRHKRALSLVMVDIDHFKSINDGFGHDVGDRLIVQIANACRDQKRKSDIVGRLGGDEFALLLPETPLEAARIVGERLRDAISRNVLALPDNNIAVTASIGVSRAYEGSSLKDLLKQADIALYQAKREGRNRVCSFEPMAAAKESAAHAEAVAAF